MNEDVVAAFRRAVETGDSDAVLATFAPEIRFANPVSARPFVGHDVLAIVVPRLLDTWKDLRYVA
jgi:SnoaL-like domain